MTARGNDHPQVQRARPMRDNEPLKPEPTPTLATTTRHLQHRHTVARISPGLMAPSAMILPVSKPRATPILFPAKKCFEPPVLRFS